MKNGEGMVRDAKVGKAGHTEAVQAQGTICVMVAKSPDDEPGPTDVERTLD
jgi:hypothetical protein